MQGCGKKDSFETEREAQIFMNFCGNEMVEGGGMLVGYGLESKVWPNFGD